MSRFSVDIEKFKPGVVPQCEQARLYMFQRELLLQERIVAEIDLPHGKVVGGSPIGIHPRQSSGDRYRSSGGPFIEKIVDYSATMACPSTQ